MTMDPQFGEISRAMRNRGVEIFILPKVRANSPKMIFTFNLVIENVIQMKRAL